MEKLNYEIWKLIDSTKIPIVKSAVIQILTDIDVKFKTVNVLDEPLIRDEIKRYSDWPTIPQLYIKGEFVGGCDIVCEMYKTDELVKLLK